MTDTKVIEKNLMYKKSLFEQLKKFKEDTSYHNLYEPYEFKYSSYLVRLFIYSPPEELKPKGNIIIPSNLDPSQAVNSPYIYHEVALPIAKILKVGDQVRDEDRYEVGDLVLLPTKNIMGWEDNPKYLQLLELSKSNMMPLNVMDIPPKLRNVDIFYRGYQFTRLGNIIADKQDEVTYLLPASEVKGKYNL
jgi:hypothetical protein